jgi:HSP20 family protein
MSLVRWEPFRDLLNLQERMNRIYEQSGRNQGQSGAGEEQLGTWAPAVDIYETEKEIVLKADLPGVNLADVDIRVENNILTVRGERHFEKDVKQDNFHRVERIYGTFVRTFTLPNTVDSEKIEASYTDGVLKIAMQKREEARPKQIKIVVNAAATAKAA